MVAFLIFSSISFGSFSFSSNGFIRFVLFFLFYDSVFSLKAEKISIQKDYIDPNIGKNKQKYNL